MRTSRRPALHDARGSSPAREERARGARRADEHVARLQQARESRAAMGVAAPALGAAAARVSLRLTISMRRDPALAQAAQHDPADLAGADDHRVRLRQRSGERLGTGDGEGADVGRAPADADARPGPAAAADRLLEQRGEDDARCSRGLRRRVRAGNLARRSAIHRQPASQGRRRRGTDARQPPTRRSR